MSRKIKIGLIFGGQSGEHEVSLQSARSIHEALDKKKYEVVLLGVDKKGTWRIGTSSNYLLNRNDPKSIRLNPHLRTITPQEAARRVDVFFPIIHGTYGEDGSLQGLLELIGLPYVGAGVLGSAVGMDKDIMKRLLRDAGLPIGKFFALTRSTLSPSSLSVAVRSLKFPIFVKPANMGSSVGVSKAHNQNELKKAVSQAFQYDQKILLEEFISGREIEVAVLGNEDPKASIAGEITPLKEFYSYQAKYIDENGSIARIPANISAEAMQRVRALAIQVFKTLECSGMGRVDFFLTRSGKFLVNEINTLPGFTNISMYPKLWAASGIPYPKLLDKLISLALKQRSGKNKLKRSFSA